MYLFVWQYFCIYVCEQLFAGFVLWIYLKFGIQLGYYNRKNSHCAKMGHFYPNWGTKGCMLCSWNYFKWFFSKFGVVLTHHIKKKLTQFRFRKKSDCSQCHTQGFFGHTTGTIFSDSRSAPMVGAEGWEKFEIVPL